MTAATSKYHKKVSKKHSTLKFNPISLTVNFFQLNTSGLSKDNVVAQNKDLEYTHLQIVALGETQKTISHDEFANFKKLQNCDYRIKARVL